MLDDTDYSDAGVVGAREDLKLHPAFSQKNQP